MTPMACCSVLTVAPADATNEKGSPHLVAISWSAGFLWLGSLSRFCIFSQCWSKAWCMSSGMVFLMLMVHDFMVARLNGGLMLLFCCRTLTGCVRSLVRLSLELSSLVLVLRLRLGCGSTLVFFWLEVGTSSSSSSCTRRLSSRVDVDLRFRVGVTLMPASWSFCLYLAAHSWSSCS